MQASRNKLRQANAVMQLQRGSIKQQLKTIKELHQQVEQAMAVLDKESGRMLNYRQLLQHPKYTKKLEHIISQRIRTTGARRRRSNKRN
jgi:hypothetical protein